VVTLANWRSAPHSRWSFQHVRELIPSADIANDPALRWTLTAAPFDLGPDFAAMLEATDTDAIVVLHRGRVVHESYRNGMTAGTPHILMSVSKSLLGIVAGILIDRGVLDPSARATSYVPELAGTAYEYATIRQLLDMQVGIAFDENYLATSGPIVEYRKAQNWDPLAPGDAPGDIRSFVSGLRERDGADGARFHYVSPNTDLLGWIIERAADRRYADLMSELLWQPLGAVQHAYITVDRLGAPRAAGGVCATVGDLARVGQLLLQNGTRDGVQIVPAAWIDDLFTAGDRAAWERGDFAPYFPNLPMHYRSKWYVWQREQPLLFALGIHGQHLFVDRDRELVVAKVSSQAVPLDGQRVAQTVRTVNALRRILT
jgi:CubicO group peptidase (beta-lactamase class C family)